MTNSGQGQEPSGRLCGVTGYRDALATAVVAGVAGCRRNSSTTPTRVGRARGAQRQALRGLKLQRLPGPDARLVVRRSNSGPTELAYYLSLPLPPYSKELHLAWSLWRRRRRTQARRSHYQRRARLNRDPLDLIH